MKEICIVNSFQQIFPESEKGGDSHFETTHWLPPSLSPGQCVPGALGFSTGATFSKVSLKEVAQRKSTSCQETSRFILVRSAGPGSAPRPGQREGEGTRSATGDSLCPWRPHWRDESKQTCHGNGAGTTCTVQPKRDSFWVRVVREGFLEDRQEGRKGPCGWEGQHGSGWTVARTSGLLERNVGEMRSENDVQG